MLNIIILSASFAVAVLGFLPQKLFPSEHTFHGWNYVTLTLLALSAVGFVAGVIRSIIESNANSRARQRTDAIAEKLDWLSTRVGDREVSAALAVLGSNLHAVASRSSNFSDADLSDSNFSRVLAANSSFDQAKLSEGNFDRASFANSSMKEGLFAHCDFARASFESANFDDAKFDNADFRRVDLSKINYDESTKFPTR